MNVQTRWMVYPRERRPTGRTDGRTDCGIATSKRPTSQPSRNECPRSSEEAVVETRFGLMRGYKVTNAKRSRMCGVACDDLSQLREKGSRKLGIVGDFVAALEDGTVVDDDDYFRSLPPQTVVVLYGSDETIVTGADYVLDALRKVNSEYLAAGERAAEFLRDRLRDVWPRVVDAAGDKSRGSTRDEDPSWFADLDTRSATKEDYMSRKSRDRVRGYLYKLRQSLLRRGHKPELASIVSYFERRLKEDDHFGCYFDRRCAGADGAAAKRRKASWTEYEEASGSPRPMADYDRSSYCDGSGRFPCQGRWNADACEFSGHEINPYASREARLIFSTWNLDHRIEKSRTIVPTLVDAVERRRDDQVVNCEYFYRLLFTNANLKLVHVACHDKSQHDATCDARHVYYARRKNGP